MLYVYKEKLIKYTQGDAVLNSLLLFLFVAFIGHWFGAVVLYLSHRFIFHGKLGKLPVLKDFRRLHAKHHRHLGENEHLFVPFWAKCAILSVIVAVAFVSPAFSAGLLSFSLLYSFRHFAIHNHDTTSRFHHHHHYHHVKANKNYSGVYPFLDKLFGTYEKPIPVKVKVRNKKS
jgi:sterol desaturase/sphingolipid hydroxylase (fatty acid hydroxylase superfamily)